MHSTLAIAVYRPSMFPEVPVLISCYSSSTENTVPIKRSLLPQPQQRHKKIEKKKDNTKKKTDVSNFFLSETTEFPLSLVLPRVSSS
jgi:hypothetical protein